MRRHISEMTSDRWIETSHLRSDGKREFRERSQFGNSHVIFEQNSDWGEDHEDEFNATDFPVGTIRHMGKYTEEKTGVPETLASIGIGAVAVYGLYKVLKYLGDE